MHLGKKDYLYKFDPCLFFCSDSYNTEFCILGIIRVWSLLFSVRVYISLHFVPVPFVKLDFRLSVF